MDIGFSLNLHDHDGDVWCECLLLHFDENLILKIKDVKELTNMIDQLKKIEKEIIENY